MTKPPDEGRIIGPNPQREKIKEKIKKILREAFKPEPVDDSTTIGDKADVILPNVNSAFFEHGEGFASIDGTLTVSALADQVIDKGGKI